MDPAHLTRQLDKLVGALETLGLEGLQVAPDAAGMAVQGTGTIDVLPGRLYISQTTHEPTGSVAGFALGKNLVETLARAMLPPGVEPGNDELSTCFDEAATALVEAWNRDGEEADALGAQGADVVTTQVESRREFVQRLAEASLTMVSQPLVLGEDWPYIVVFGPAGWAADEAISWPDAVAVLDAMEGVVTPLDEEAQAEGAAAADSAETTDDTGAAAAEEAGAGESGAAKTSPVADGTGLDAALVVVDESGAFRKWFFEQIRAGNLKLVPADKHEVTCGGQAAVMVVGPHHCAIPVHSDHIFTIALAS